MAKYNFKAAPENKEEVKSYNDTGKHDCDVFGCPRLATIKTNHWHCRYHNLRSAEMFDRITLLLKNHEREINWYEKVINMPFHEYEKFKGNAPQTMLSIVNEDLKDYRVRVAKYVRDLLANPNTHHSVVKYTYADNAIRGHDD